MKYCVNSVIDIESDVAAMQIMEWWPCTAVHNSNITYMPWNLKSLATQLFAQQLVQVNIKENIQALHYWPFVREIHQWLVDFPHKAPVMQKKFPSI